MALESYFETVQRGKENVPSGRFRHTTEEILAQTVFREIIAAILLQKECPERAVPISRYDYSLLISYGLLTGGDFSPLADEILANFELDFEALDQGKLDLKEVVSK